MNRKGYVKTSANIFYEKVPGNIVYLKFRNKIFPEEHEKKHKFKIRLTILLTTF